MPTSHQNTIFSNQIHEYTWYYFLNKEKMFLVKLTYIFHANNEYRCSLHAAANGYTVPSTPAIACRPRPTFLMLNDTIKTDKKT